MLCDKFGYIDPVVLVNVFVLFRYCLIPLDKDGAFICINLNPRHPRMLTVIVPSLVEIGTVVLEKLEEF